MCVRERVCTVRINVCIIKLITVQHFSPPSVYITEGEITTPRRGNAYTHYLLHTVWSSVLVYLIRASLYEAVPLASGIHLLIVIWIILRTLRPVLPRLFGKIIATFQLLLPHTDKILMHACMHWFSLRGNLVVFWCLLQYTDQNTHA